MGTEQRIEKVKQILADRKPYECDPGKWAVQMEGAIVQLLIICGNQQKEIETLKDHMVIAMHNR